MFLLETLTGWRSWGSLGPVCRCWLDDSPLFKLLLVHLQWPERCSDSLVQWSHSDFLGALAGMPGAVGQIIQWCPDTVARGARVICRQDRVNDLESEVYGCLIPVNLLDVIILPYSCKSARWADTCLISVSLLDVLVLCNSIYCVLSAIFLSP